MLIRFIIALVVLFVPVRQPRVQVPIEVPPLPKAEPGRFRFADLEGDWPDPTPPRMPE
jgi:hypothetical protein